MLSPFFSREDFVRVSRSSGLGSSRLQVLAEMLRFNLLSMIACAGSGHIGGCLSLCETMAALYFSQLDADPARPEKLDREALIMSKGHSVPVQYVALAARGFIPDAALSTLRRYRGLQGHADISTPGIDANTGSLGMGLSKAKGHAWALRSRRVKRRSFAIVGDGELQEGQNWEAIQSIPALGLDRVVMLVDRNRVQTDKFVEDIVSCRRLAAVLKDFGWKVLVLDGTKAAAVDAALERTKASCGPWALVLETRKGQGISFMECQNVLRRKSDLYRWHGGIPDPAQYRAAAAEIGGRIRRLVRGRIALEVPAHDGDFTRAANLHQGDSVQAGFAKALLELAAADERLVVLDGDLGESCGIYPFLEKFPRRYIQDGISEQDMVSMAGALAARGLVPVVNTYSAFLSSRANEQIFNNATEHRKVVYIGHMAGLIPAQPGKSHQGVRDISLLRAIPGLMVCEPATPAQAAALLRWAVREAEGGVYMRLAICKGLLPLDLPLEPLRPGRGQVVREGSGAALVGYGPVILGECLEAARLVQERSGKGIRVIAMPWLNVVDGPWLRQALEGVSQSVVVENHSVAGGLGEAWAQAMRREGLGAGLSIIGLEDFAQTGDTLSILKHYGLDREALAEAVLARS